MMSSHEKGWKVLLKLAAKMVYNINSGISDSTENWETLSGHSIDNIRVMIRRKMDNSSLSRGTRVTTASSFWLSVSPIF